MTLKKYTLFFIGLAFFTGIIMFLFVVEKSFLFNFQKILFSSKTIYLFSEQRKTRLQSDEDRLYSFLRQFIYSSKIEKVIVILSKYPENEEMVMWKYDDRTLNAISGNFILKGKELTLRIYLIDNNDGLRNLDKRDLFINSEFVTIACKASSEINSIQNSICMQNLEEIIENPVLKIRKSPL